MSELSRLRWRCRRGMKELDLVLNRYLEADYPTADEAEKGCFGRLLEMQDPELYRLILGKESTEDPGIRKLIGALRRSIGN